MRRIATSVFVIAAMRMVHPAGATDDNAMTGVWKGTVGTYPVMACFDGNGGYSFGSYYYLSQRKIIPLESANGTWLEPKSGRAEQAHWKLAPTIKRGLHGQWSDGKKKLPIDLRPVNVSAEIDQAICGSPEFNSARFTEPQEIRAKAALGKQEYTKLVVDVGKQFESSLSSFEVPGTSAAISQVNAALRSPLPAIDMATEFRDCMMGATGSNGQEGFYSHDAAPTYLSRNFVISKWEAGDYCGGAHPNWGYGYDAYDLQTGEKIDVGSWIDLKSTATVLPQKIASTWQGEDEDMKSCRETVMENEFWEYGLSEKGIIIMPSLPHAMTSCVDEIVFGFDEVQPFLTEGGKAGVQRFTADIKAQVRS